MMAGGIGIDENTYSRCVQRTEADDLFDLFQQDEDKDKYVKSSYEKHGNLHVYSRSNQVANGRWVTVQVRKKTLQSRVRCMLLQATITQCLIHGVAGCNIKNYYPTFIDFKNSWKGL